MTQGGAILNLVVAAAIGLAAPVVQAQDARAPDVESLLEQLAQPDQDRWVRIERQIQRAWSQSGSAVADYLFQRGQDALREGDTGAAIAHFSAVIDHAPDFAEAWNARATAFFMENRLGPAMADIEEVLARNPDHFGALAGMGAILEQVDRPEAAREAYSAALALNPHRPSLRQAVERLERDLAGRAL
ncbi:MAG: Tetratricopeptide repeat/TPR repeat [Rhodobacteraceae bacterium HLUCCA12]|nr:MAG: Tetratricopeptide repeat/TPR repeat [Rhodobacteraceae bacterium HLUCCA12]